jgi:hypothetical protein
VRASTFGDTYVQRNEASSSQIQSEAISASWR